VKNSLFLFLILSYVSAAFASLDVNFINYESYCGNKGGALVRGLVLDEDIAPAKFKLSVLGLSFYTRISFGILKKNIKNDFPSSLVEGRSSYSFISSGAQIFKEISQSRDS
jgi:hypothetical protein